MPESLDPADFRGFIDAEFNSLLRSYRERPDNIVENAGQEASIAQGGYGRKQVQELIQNSIDALRGSEGDIEVLVANDVLYVANQGEPFDRAGVKSLLHSNMSDKNDDQIGHFGLGFKSVLQISDKPQIFTAGVAFGFDAERSKELLSEIYPGLDDYPKLRVPFNLEPGDERALDPHLDELLTRHVTVVRLPITHNRDIVRQQIEDFPGEVLLFSPAVRRLHLEIRGAHEFRRTWSSDSLEADLPSGIRAVQLTDDDKTSEWLIASMEYLPTNRAKQEAGSIHARDTTTVTWAVPREASSWRGRGKAWNYFPTNLSFTLSGIVNAAFKMNDDRVSVLETRYNEEILSRAVPRLVAALIPHLSTKADPAAHFPLMPARGKEDDQWVRTVMIKPVNELLASVPAVPDLSGTLRTVGELSVRPALTPEEEETLPDSWSAQARSAGVTDWVHESALRNRDRAALVDRLLVQADRRRTTFQEWVEGLAAADEVGGYAAAIRFASLVIKSRTSGVGPMDITPVREARIIRRQSGSVTSIGDGLVLQASPTQRNDALVDPLVAAVPGVTEALTSLGAKKLKGTEVLAQELEKLAKADAPSVSAVDAFWCIASEHAASGPREASEVQALLQRFHNAQGIPVLTASHEVRPLSLCWQEGPLLSSNRAEDRSIVIRPDDPFFTPTELKRFAVPRLLPESRHETFARSPKEWQEEVRAACRDQATAKDGDSATIGSMISLLGTDRVGTTPGLTSLAHASLESRARVTAELTKRRMSIDVSFTVYVRERAQSFDFPRELKVLTPDGMWVRDHGAFHTPMGYVPTSECVRNENPSLDGLLPQPALDSLDATDWDLLGVTALTDTSVWNDVLETSHQAVQDGRFSLAALHRLYGIMAQSGVAAPRQLLVGRDGQHKERMPIATVVLPLDAQSDGHLRTHSTEGRVFVDEPLLQDSLVTSWKLRPIEIRFSTEAVVSEAGSSEANTLKDRFPYLPQTVGATRKLASYSLVPVNSLEIHTVNDYDSHIEVDDTEALFIDVEQKSIYYRSTLQTKGILSRLLQYVGSRDDASTVIEKMAAIEQEVARTSVLNQLRRLKSDQERVLYLLGEERLRELIPDQALDLLSIDPSVKITPDLLYRMAENVHGSNLWSEMTATLNGDEEAEAWLKEVRSKDLSDLGFSPNFISTRAPKSPVREEAMGPVVLNPLHDYQDAAAKAVCEMLSAPAGKNRGLMQLPTGAGKTRVAVESLIRNVKRLAEEGQKKHLILWIAQSEELCEQAVTAWVSGWRSLGLAGTPMIASRFWDGRSVRDEESPLHVVVSTYQTLRNIAKAGKDSARALRYKWLQDPDVVVIDEAHGAVAKSYTEILRWLGRSSASKNNKPLLGLSATPYRGRSEEQTKALVKRFGENLIEPREFFTAENAHGYLQSIRVLSTVRQRSLEGTILQRRKGTVLPENWDKDPNTARGDFLESMIDLRTVADDRDRNREILDDITYRVEHEGIEHAIVFAASVAHAQAIASVLHAKGISAAAIHGGTDPARRRLLVEEFTRGDIKVLTNFDVFSQGFDAPKVDAVYLCRPTFSPNKYIQMIGRGLRGPANGGSEEVLIVNIDDNLENFDGKLAYTEFHYLWNADK